MAQQAYTVLNQRIVRGAIMARAGDVVYLSSVFDYGAAANDAESTGKPHLSVSTQSNGAGQSFTIPTEDVRPIAIFNAPKAAPTYRRR